MKKSVDRTLTLETMAILALACLIVSVIFNIHWLVYISIALIFIGNFLNPIAKEITRAWLLFGNGVGAVMNRVILALVFFLILTPIAIFYRLFSKKSFKQASKRKSSFYNRDHMFGSDDLINPW